MRVPAALVGAVTVCQAECQPLLILVSLGFFSPLIHVSDSRRGTLKSAAHHSWSSCPHSWGVTLLGFTGFHLLFLWVFHSGMSTHPSWHLCLLSSICHIVIHGGQEGRLGLRQAWTAEGTGCSLLVYPLPSHATAVTVRALCSSTITAGRWACCGGLLPRQHHCAGMQWPSSCGGHQGYWGRVGTPTLEQENLEWLLRSKLQGTWRKRRQV